MPEKIPGKLPPQNIEAEKSVLGCLMVDKNAIIKVVDFLRPEDFYRGIHQEIYRSCQELFAKGEPIDLLSVSNRLKEKGLLEEVGGVSYLTELVESVPAPSHVLNYAKIVQRKRVLRDLIAVSQEIEALGYNETEDTESLLDEAEHKIFSIAQKSLSQDFIPVKDTLEAAFERIDKLYRKETGTRGVPTGFIELDNLLAGLQKSDLIILAARPTMGKSALSFNIAANLAINHKIPVGIFSLEMSKDHIVDRLISSISGVDLWRLRTGRLSEEGEENDFTRIREALSVLSEAPIFIDDAATSTVLQMKAMCRRLQANHGLGLVIKAMARELDVPVLVISQLSRAVEQRSPQIPKLSDLRQSGTIEQDADVVLFIYREDRYRPETSRKGIADIIVAKHRNGPVGKVELYFDERTVSFKNLEKGLGFEEAEA